jgi:hypothetical protein
MSLNNTFTVNNLPYVRRGERGTWNDVQLVRGFRVKPLEDLFKVCENGILPYKNEMTIEKAVRVLKVPLKKLEENGFGAYGIDLRKFQECISAGKCIKVKLRSGESLTGNTYVSAVIGRVCEPSLVLKNFDIRDALLRLDMKEADKLLLAAKYLKSRTGKDRPKNDPTSLIKEMVEMSAVFMPDKQIKALKYHCERWYFISKLSKTLKADFKIDVSVEEAISYLKVTTDAKYSVEDAMSWLGQNRV